MAPSLSAGSTQFTFTVEGLPLKVLEFTAREAVSSPFEVHLALASEDEIAFDEVIGKEALLGIAGAEAERFFHGIVCAFGLTGARGRFSLYRAQVVPTLWLLDLSQDLRIFQNLDVPQIVSRMLDDAALTADRYAFRLQGRYQPREYCVQYRETGLAFISRLLEEEGIFYFFEHSEDKHLLVFGDSPVNYQPIAGETHLIYHASDALVPEGEAVTGFALSSRIVSGRYAQNDFNFEQPTVNLTTAKAGEAFKALEVYDYPGHYRDEATGKRLADIRLQQGQLSREQASGASVCPRLTPGFTFTLSDHASERLNREYLLTALTHEATQAQEIEELAGEGETRYTNRFECLPSSVGLRPVLKTPRPVVEGPQTAIVVGPADEEIYTDRYGRVKVQFHWDREGGRNENSSCWIRVASGMAGGSYGQIFTPRVGQEVVVDFLEGDPDRPLITGRVYNADNPPPYPLPEEKTKSTIKSGSSKGGEGFNEIRFEDKKGDEELFIHAEKDLDERIKDSRRTWVGNDDHLVVKRDRVENVERDRHLLVKQDAITEIQRDRHLKVGGKQALDVSGTCSLKVGGDVIEVIQGNHSRQVSRDVLIKGMNLVLEGMTGITLKVGGNFITLNAGGVFLNGTMLMLNSGGSALSATAGRPVSPASPLTALIAGDARPGRDKVYDAPAHVESAPEEVEDEKITWIEIELVDEDDQPVPGERYRVTLPDGKTQATGTTDNEGRARIRGIQAGQCQITFPDLDQDAWEKI